MGWVCLKKFFGVYLYFDQSKQKCTIVRTVFGDFVLVIVCSFFLFLGGGGGLCFVNGGVMLIECLYICIYCLCKKYVFKVFLKV